MALEALTQPIQSPLLRDHKPRRADLKTPRLSIVVVNYRHWEQTEALIRQLSNSNALRSLRVVNIRDASATVSFPR